MKLVYDEVNHSIVCLAHGDSNVSVSPLQVHLNTHISDRPHHMRTLQPLFATNSSGEMMGWDGMRGMG